ncbi:MAG: hypothetical protein GY928_02015 [Colwellia sp.]|nr:hypothetical protein [Colwellia sp.]
MKATKQSTDGTSFNGTEIVAYLIRVFRVANELDALSDDYIKCKDEFVMSVHFEFETDNGDVFTVYNLDVYRDKYKHEPTTFRIGGKGRYVTETALDELKEELEKLN